MTELSMTLAEYLRKIDVDLEGAFLREGASLRMLRYICPKLKHTSGAPRD